MRSYMCGVKLHVQVEGSILGCGKKGGAALHLRKGEGRRWHCVAARARVWRFVCGGGGVF